MLQLLIRIIERVTKCLDSNLDISPDPTVLFWNLLLLPDSTNEDYLTTPINIVSLLNDRRADIQQFIPRLDNQQFITMKNLSLDIPSFKTSPFMNKRTISTVNLEFSLSQCGTVTIVGIARLKSENSTITNTTSLLSQEPPQTIYPTSFEIAQGLNMTNLPADEILFKTFYINQIDSVKNITFSQLQDRTVYDFYISAINDFPMYNYYMADAEVVKLSIKTIKNKSNIIYHSFTFPKSALYYQSLSISSPFRRHPYYKSLLHSSDLFSIFLLSEKSLNNITQSVGLAYHFIQWWDKPTLQFYVYQQIKQIKMKFHILLELLNKNQMYPQLH